MTCTYKADAGIRITHSLYATVAVKIASYKVTFQIISFNILRIAQGKRLARHNAVLAKFFSDSF